jgi:hypothetical protein
MREDVPLPNISVDDLLNVTRAVGFIEAQIVQRYDIFEDVPHPSDALEFGTRGISLRARKPA